MVFFLLAAKSSVKRWKLFLSFSSCSCCVAYVQVDLFFYRDPEEAKEQEEEEAPVAPEYGAVADYTGVGAADQWASDQWTSEVGAVPPAVPPAAGVEWAAAQGQNPLLISLII